MLNDKGFAVSDSTGGALRKKRLNIADRDYFKAAKSGKFAGVFGAVLKLNALSQKMVSVKIGTTGYPFMINKEGIMIAHPKKELIFKLDTKTLKGSETIIKNMMAQEITKDINTVNQSSREMADRSDRVSLSAEDLSRLSAQLDQMVGRFKV